MSERQENTLDELIAEYIQACETGKSQDTDELIARHPEYAEELREFFRIQMRIRGVTQPISAEMFGQHEDEARGLFGDYELLELVARGGMGVVYRARQRSLNRIVALKMVLSERLTSERNLQRFQAEAETAANLKHPNIVVIHDVGQHDGQTFYSMAFVEGPSLSRMVRENPLPPDTAARYVCSVARAMAYAHSQGVLHRDLKPSNILIDLDDQPQVTDFGLAMRVDQESSLTLSGEILGTPSYMSPEQALAKRNQIGPRSDVYSLGAVLYELLTGRPPFRAASSLETIRQLVESTAPAPRLLNSMVPRDLETITMKCLEKNPTQRYRTADELAEELDRFQRGAPILARPISRPERFRRWCMAHPLIALLTGIACTLLMVILIGGPIVSIRLTAALRQSQQDRSRALEDRNIAREAAWLAKESQLQSLISEARASRYSGRTGQRFGTLSAIGKAVDLSHELSARSDVSEELRNLAISALALPDVRPADLWLGMHQHVEALSAVYVDPTFRFVGDRSESGELIVRRLNQGPTLGAEVCRLPEWPGKGGYLAWGPQGNFLVRGNRSTKELQLWRIQLGKATPTLDSVAGCSAFGYSPDGQYFVVLQPNEIQVYELATGQLVCVHEMLETGTVHLRWKGGIPEIPFHPTHSQAALIKPQGVVIVDFLSGEVVAEFNQLGANPTALDWHPSGELLAIAYASVVHLWNVSSQKIEQSWKHPGTGLNLAFNRTGDLLATKSWSMADGVKFWNPFTGELGFQAEHDGRLSRPAFSASNIFVSRWRKNWQEKSSPLTEIRTSTEYRTIKRGNLAIPHNGIGNVAIHPDGRLLAVTGHEIRLIDLHNGSMRAVIPVASDHLEFDSDGALVAVTTLGLLKWPVSTAQDPAQILQLGPPERLALPGTIERYASSCRAEPQVQAVARGNQGAQIWQGNTFQNPLTVQHPDCRYVAVSPDGAYVATGSHNGFGIKVWQAETGHLIQELVTQTRHTEPQFSPDGRWLHDRNGKRWELQDWKQQTVRTGDTADDHRCVFAYSPDSSMLAASVVGQPLISLYNANTLEPLAELQDPHQHVSESLIFSPDGTQLIANCGETIHVWELNRIREELQTLNLHWNMPSMSERSDRRDSDSACSLLQVELLGNEFLENPRLFDTLSEAHLVAELAVNPWNARAHYQLGISLISRKEHATASGHLQLALALNPDLAQTYADRATRAWKIHDWQTIVDFTTPLIEQRSTSVVMLNYRAWAHQAQEKYGAAIADWSRLIKLVPDQHVHLLNRADCYGLSDQWDKAIADQRTFIAFERRRPNAPSLPDIHQSARLSVQQWANSHDSNSLVNPLYAQALVETCLEEEPDNPEFLSTLALILIRQERLFQAKKTLDRAEKMSTSGPALFSKFCKCLLLIKSGQSGEAESLFEDTLKEFQLQQEPSEVLQQLHTEIKLLLRDNVSITASKTLHGHGAAVNCVAWNSDGSRVASGSQNNVIKVWNTIEGRCELTLYTGKSDVKALAFSPDDKQLLSGHRNGQLTLWNATSGEHIYTFPEHTSWSLGVAFSPDGRRVASCNTDNLVQIWDVGSKQEILRLEDHTDDVFSVAFSPDGKRIASGGKDRILRIWDADSGQLLSELSGHRHYILSVCFNSAGSRIATGSEDQTVRIWDVATERALQTLVSHEDVVFAVGYSPDDQLIVTGSKDQSLKIWNAETGVLLHTLRGHRGTVRGVRFHPTENRVASASYDWSLKIWDVPAFSE